MVMTLFSESIVASKAISEPLELVSLSVIKLSTLVSVRAESSISLISSSKVMVISESTATEVDKCAGLNSMVGAVERSEERRVGKECRSRWSP
mgnify:CR=1 FL=1